MADTVRAAAAAAQSGRGTARSGSGKPPPREDAGKVVTSASWIDPGRTSISPQPAPRTTAAVCGDRVAESMTSAVAAAVAATAGEQLPSRHEVSQSLQALE